MASQDESTTARYDSLHEALTRASQLGLNVSMNVHGCPIEFLLELVEDGVLDAIEKGAPGCGPTGRMQSGEYLKGKAELIMFMEDGHEQARRLKRQEDDVISELAAALDSEGTD